MSPSRSDRTGVLLINLGTPDAPRPREVRRYLREFLSDPRVLSMHPLARWLLLHLVILPLRPRRSAEAYAQIWQPEGSPLLIHGLALRERVAAELGPDYTVELGMRYGNPSLAEALGRLRQAAVGRIVALPLFPQYSAAATASALARLHELLASDWDVPTVTTLGAFYGEPGFHEAWRVTAADGLARFAPDHVLFSYHGLPESQLRRSDPSGRFCLSDADCCNEVGTRNRDCYRAQCLATTRALARALALPPERCSSSFQSRLGRTPWIRPYTDEVLGELAARGVRRLAVLCPAFASDCLETLEEIGLRAREQWLELGGEDFHLAPCPNADPAFARAIADWVRSGRP